ncbi:alpha/beta hydrolase fold [Rhizobium favelukesii]|uniref:Alpha/beta hydrolase fold n=1 Tax=Rhizobium favelukesii TaxID=348824 RepID=W6R7C6_9HYPH|nr:alpha/beta hydrolase fold [Rhizobium favelukesii]
MPGYADALLEALESMRVERFIAVGHSLGGHVVLEMIARNAAVDGALIFGTPPIVNSPEGLQAGFKPSPKIAYTGNAELTEEQVGMVVELALGADALDEEPFHSAVRRTDGRARQYMIESAVAGRIAIRGASPRPRLFPSRSSTAKMIRRSIWTTSTTSISRIYGKANQFASVALDTVSTERRRRSSRDPPPLRGFREVAIQPCSRRRRFRGKG